MHRLFADRQLAAWAILMGATVVTAVLGLEQAGASTIVGTALLAIAFLKLRLVGIHFMELATAPAGLRLAFEGYVVLVFGVLIALYLVG